MIQLHNLCFQYNETPVLNGLSGVFEQGRVHGIIGLNGAGKTTLFRLLAGFMHPTHGTIRIDGAALSKTAIAFLETELYFYPKLSAREFLAVFTEKSIRFEEEKLAALFRLPLDELISSYSTGMRKKLMLLSHLKQNKQVFILDEPFNGLDLETNKALEVIIGILKARGKTIFISSHIIGPLLHICDAVHHLAEGGIRKTYHPEDYASLEQDIFGKLTQAWTEQFQDLL